MQWNSTVQAWIYPGNPAQNADEEYKDGRVIHTLKPEYYRLLSTGDLEQVTVANDGENGYTVANAASVKSYSTEQYVTVSGSSDGMRAMLNNSTKRAAAITTLTNFVNEIGFTGIDIDWEGYAQWTADDYSKFKVFVTDLKTSLGTKKLMVCVPPIGNTLEQSYYPVKYEEIAPLVDYVEIMAYDYQYDYGGGSAVAPTAWVTDIVNWYIAKVGNLNKAIVGVNSYGYQATVDAYQITILTKAQAMTKPGYSATATLDTASNERSWVNSNIHYRFVDTAGLNAKRTALEALGVQRISVWHLGGNDWFNGKTEPASAVTPPEEEEPVDPPATPSDNGIYRWNGTAWVLAEQTSIAPSPVLTDLEADLTNNFVPSVPSTLGTGTNQNYRMPTPNELRDIVAAMYLISSQGGKTLSDIDTTEAAALLTPHGFTISKGTDEANGLPYVMVVPETTYPSSSNYRSWGRYYFSGMNTRTSLIISAPHPLTDGNSEYIALRLAQQVPGSLYALSSVNRKAKDYMVTEVSTDHTAGTYTLTFRGQTTAAIAYNASIATIQTAVEALSTVGVGKVTVTGDPANTSLHAFINLDGSLYNSAAPTDTITIGTNSLTGGTYLTLDHDADAAHNANSAFNKVTDAFARVGYANIQLHGFSDVSSSVPRMASAMLSPGSSNKTILIEAVRSSLEAEGFDVFVKDRYDTQGIYFSGSPTGGTFTLTVNAQTTAAITYSATAATMATNIQNALQALSSIGTNNVRVSVSQNSNGSIPAFVITFTNRFYHNGSQITVASSSLTGGTSPLAVIPTPNSLGLMADSNTGGDIAEVNGTPFIHLELSQTVRTDTTKADKVVSALAAANLPQISAAAMPVLAEAGHDISQAPLVNGSGATIGVSPVAARADHRHPMTGNTPVAGDYVRRSDSNGSWTAVSSNQIKIDLALTDVDNTSDANKPVSTAQQTALDAKVNKAGDTMTGSLTLTNATFTAGTTTDVIGTVLAAMRNGVQVGRIDNNSNGLRVQAQTGSLQLRGSGNTGITVDSAGGAQVAGALTAEGRSVVTSTTGAPKLTVATTAPSSPAVNDIWIDTN